MPVEKRAARRGCLHKLVVQNFKSYAGQLTIGPFKDFTCVIGPNGSGKTVCKGAQDVCSSSHLFWQHGETVHNLTLCSPYLIA
jgi:hypothetical protein